MKAAFGLGLAVVLAAAAPARAETWCVRDKDGVTPAICAFSSADDCIRAAVVGPSGIVCAQETGAAPTSNGTRSAAPHGKHKQRQARD